MSNKNKHLKVAPFILAHEDIGLDVLKLFLVLYNASRHDTKWDDGNIALDLQQPSPQYEDQKAVLGAWLGG